MKAVLFLLLAICAVEAGAQPREVWRNTDTYSDPFALMVDLTGALESYPYARRFRLDWGIAFPHGGTGGLLIYDKTRQILWISQQNNGLWPAGEDEGEPNAIYNGSYNSQQWRFSGVTPNRLRLLSARYGEYRKNQPISDTAYEVSFFPRLSQFGCRGGLVGRVSQRWREKYRNGQRVRLR